MVNSIISIIQDSTSRIFKTDSIEGTVKTLRTVLIELDDDRYDLRDNTLYFDNKALFEREVLDIAEENTKVLSEEDRVFLHAILSYFYFKYDLRNKKEFEFDICELKRWTAEQIGIEGINFTLKLKELNNLLLAIEEIGVFRLIDIRKKGDSHLINLAYIHYIVLDILYKMHVTIV